MDEAPALISTKAHCCIDGYGWVKAIHNRQGLPKNRNGIGLRRRYLWYERRVETPNNRLLRPQSLC
jgi:hypothetical protein